MASRTLASIRFLVSGLVLMAGAGAYALSQGAIGVKFNATPLLIGVVALVAGLVGPRRHLVPVGSWHWPRGEWRCSWPARSMG